MGHYLGIDLGSTTTKAVLIDGAGKVQGFGLTNTRSSYEVAAAIARGEALADAQLSRIEAELSRLGQSAAELGAEVRRAYRVEVAAGRLASLRARTLELARATPKGDGAAQKLEALFAKMLADATPLFSPLAADRSRFFRDVVAARFLSEAEELAQAREISFELAMGAFDRAVVEMENTEVAAELGPTLERAMARARFSPAKAQAVAEARGAVERQPLEVSRMVGTGYGRQRLPFPKEQIRSEILCHGLGAHALFSKTRTVLDIGGQDTKAIQVDEQGVVTSFQMNDRCAAGCGRYLGYIAEEMNLGIHELGPLALTATRAVRISSTCTVFAGVELRERLSLGERRENILLGLHRAIVLRAMSLLARSGGVKDEFTFTGGVARNPAVVRELQSLIDRHYGERRLNVHSDSIYTGALGAALFAQRQGEA
ncbi:MAG: benzoyl-CoA reductase subunit A [Myxococcales bacterium]|nr:benzoyl-CoA reductase subunit A [Myxococcales bacterium]